MSTPFETMMVRAMISAASKVSKGELVRFARRFLNTRQALAFESESSVVGIAEQIGQLLARSDKLDESVFSEIARMNPNGSEAVDQAHAMWLAGDVHKVAGGNTSPPTADGKSAPKAGGEEEEWQKRLSEALEGAPRRKQQAPQKLTEALALLGSFDALALDDDEILSRLGGNVGDRTLERLAPVCDQLLDGRWALRKHVRREAISSILDRRKAFSEALELAQAIDRDGLNQPYLALLREVRDAGAIDVGITSTFNELLAAQEVADWFIGSRQQPIDTDRVAVLLDSQRRIEPLRKLVGKHFHGREEELKTLRRRGYFGEDKERILVLTGNGGAGKSALLGKRILEMLEQIPPAPVVYIDFDRSEVDPENPRGIVETIARSLGLLFSGTDSGNDWIALESASAGDVAVPMLDLSLSHRADLEELVTALAERIAGLPTSDGALFVFDTFEQVMMRGARVVGDFHKFLKALLEAVPGALAILSGRGAVAWPDAKVSIKLTDLDQMSADAVLAARGVNDSQDRQQIYDALGGNPLLLRIASTAFLSGGLDLAELGKFDAQAEGLRRQGILYSRTLGYIGDAEVERLAHPGLVVRRITPKVISKVLASICEIEPTHAEAIFKRLPRFVDLFELEEPLPGEAGDRQMEGLQHRQDLRESVIDLMTEDEEWRDRIPLIHRSAIAYYEGSEDPRGRAEWLYHSLMLDEPLEVLDAIWEHSQEEALNRSLGRTWSDPIPARARNWLAIRMGLDPTESMDDLRLADWEIVIASDVRDLLLAGGYDEALVALAARKERTTLSPLPELEARALLLAGRAHDALAVVADAINRAKGSAKAAHILSLTLLEAESAIEGGTVEQAAETAGKARRMAVALKDERSWLKALELAARAEDAEAKQALATAFLEASPSLLRSDAKIAGMIVKTLGENRPEVMGKAATVFANIPEMRYVSIDPQELTSLLEKVAVQNGGEQVLAGLAARVGLSEKTSSAKTIAFDAIRHGLHGVVLSNSLRAFGDDPGIRSQSFDMLKGLTE